jgi:hypothetical protein
MSDPIPTPGVRPGQVWHEVKPKRRYRAYDWTVCNVTGIDVVMTRRTASQIVGRQTLREGFEQRYRLVSEGGAPDA